MADPTSKAPAPDTGSDAVRVTGTDPGITHHPLTKRGDGYGYGYGYGYGDGYGDGDGDGYGDGGY